MIRRLIFTLMAAAAVAVAFSADAQAARNGVLGYTSQGQIFTIRADGGGLRQLTRGKSEPAGPAYSRDGRYLAVAQGDTLAVLSAGTGRLVRRVPIQLGWVEDPAWSPGGTTLVFSACAVTESTDIEECVEYGIYRVRIDGSRLQRIGTGVSPAWSPDGRTIAYVAETGTRSDSCPELSVIPAAGGERRAVLPRRADGRCPRRGQPDFSPRGTRLVYTASPNIRSVKLDGSGDALVARAPRGAGTWRPHWSPDGRYVAYGQSGTKTQTGLWTARWGGGSPKRVTSRFALALDWAPIR